MSISNSEVRHQYRQTRCLQLWLFTVTLDVVPMLHVSVPILVWGFHGHIEHITLAGKMM